VFQPEGGEVEPESRCRVNWDIKLEQARASWASHARCCAPVRLAAWLRRASGGAQLRRAQLRISSLVGRRHCCPHAVFARWRARPCAGCIGFNARASACKGSGPCIYTGRTAAASELEFEGERSLVCCGQKRGRTLAAHLVRLLPYTHLHPHVQALNDHINVEYTASYAYHALFSYFDRDTVGLAGFAKFFAEQSLEERGHAEEFMKYQNIRGGKVCVCVLAGIRGSVA